MEIPSLIFCRRTTGWHTGLRHTRFGRNPRKAAQGILSALRTGRARITTTATTTTVATTTTEKQLAADSTFSVHFVDVGQADAALVECDGHYMLIDGGNKADSDIMYSVLKNEGVDKLDIVVGTHAHEDHIGGLAGALNYATADLILCPVTDYDSDAFADFKRYAEQNGNGLTVPKMGDTYTLGSADILILGVNCGNDENNSSIVLKISYGETSFIFTGDADRETEQAIINSGVDLSADVLKVGHHGSDTSTSYVWLNEIMPEYAVISVGEGNSYGHPTDDVLSRLRDAEVNTFRTDLNGDIIARSDGRVILFVVDKEVERRLAPHNFAERQRQEDERYLQKQRSLFAADLEQQQQKGREEQQQKHELFEKVKYKTTKKTKGDWER